MLTLLVAILLAQSGVAGDGHCEGVVTVEAVEGARLLGACSMGGGQRRMAITVANTRERAAGRLRSFHIGFCSSSVVRAFAPPGWFVTLSENSGVTFSTGDDAVERSGVRSGKRLGGFIVELHAGWRYSDEVSVFWEFAGEGKGRSDVCQGLNAG